MKGPSIIYKSNIHSSRCLLLRRCCLRRCHETKKLITVTYCNLVQLYSKAIDEWGRRNEIHHSVKKLISPPLIDSFSRLFSLF